MLPCQRLCRHSQQGALAQVAALTVGMHIKESGLVWTKFCLATSCPHARMSICPGRRFRWSLWMPSASTCDGVLAQIF